MASQEQLATLPAERTVPFSGHVSCDDAADTDIWLVLLPPPPAPGEPHANSGPLRPLARAKVGNGPYTLLTERKDEGGEGVLIAFLDGDADGRQGPGESLLMAAEGATLSLDENHTDLRIDCENNRAQPKGDAGEAEEPPPADADAPQHPPPAGSSPEEKGAKTH